MISLDDDALQQFLKQTTRIAVVGLSSDPSKASHEVASYLLNANYTIYPVNPKADEIFGRPVYRSLSEIKDPIDIVDIFRKSEDVAPFVDEAIAIRAKAVWLQLGITDPIAEQKALDAGLIVVSDHCLKIEHRRLLGGYK